MPLNLLAFIWKIRGWIYNLKNNPKNIKAVIIAVLVLGMLGYGYYKFNALQRLTEAQAAQIEQLKEEITIKNFNIDLQNARIAQLSAETRYLKDKSKLAEKEAKEKAEIEQLKELAKKLKTAEGICP